MSRTSGRLFATRKTRKYASYERVATRRTLGESLLGGARAGVEVVFGSCSAGGVGQGAQHAARPCSFQQASTTSPALCAPASLGPLHECAGECLDLTGIKTCRRFPISIACVPPLNAYLMDQRHACTDEAPLAPGEQAAGHVHEDDFKAWFPFCQALPKAELHAHINGSVREATIMCVSLAAARQAACRTR